jgi:hypothetical protein
MPSAPAESAGERLFQSLNREINPMYVKLLEPAAVHAATADDTPPFNTGDRVWYRPRPDGVEVVKECERSARGRREWYCLTERGSEFARATRYTPAVNLSALASQGDFHNLDPRFSQPRPALQSPAAAADDPVAPTAASHAHRPRGRGRHLARDLDRARRGFEGMAMVRPGRKYPGYSELDTLDRDLPLHAFGSASLQASRDEAQPPAWMSLLAGVVVALAAIAILWGRM